MKKILSIVLALVICMFVSGCGGKANTNTNTNSANGNKGNDSSVVEEIKSTELVLGEKNSIADYADFSLFKVVTTKKLTASLKENFSITNSNASETYVDIILDWTNTSSDPVNSEEILKISASNASGKEYTDDTYAIETDSASPLDRYEDIAPLSNVKLHCAVSVPETETDIILKLVIKNNEYVYNYSLGKTVSDAKEIKVGETIEEKDLATLAFKGIEYTDDLLPSNTSGVYSHYPIDNSSDTYLVVKFDITNYATSNKDCDDFVGIKAVYMDKYTYTGNVVVEDEDGKGFNSYDVAPLTTRHFYYMFEVPKTVIKNEVKLMISFGGKEYTYTGK